MTDRRIIDALTPLVTPLLALDFESRAEVARRLGLTLACCTGCGCYIGADYCHPAEDAVEWEALGECTTPCRSSS